ncbi:MAG: T9SS type A sorting domain-containing protein, partial [Candidatus Kapabacteria bacterium]|nr:T9SS type A sorting domain-containing protein [Candidatus Kapabacteria bacterium]
GVEFEKITSEIYPNKFNVSNSDNDFDSRSDNNGPEPEGLFVTNYRGEWYAFIGLERIGGIMIYNINNPEEPYFVNYTNNRDFNALFSDSPSKEELIQIGDLGIEGLIRIPANESPNGQDLIVTANETSGSISIFSLISNPELNVKNLITCKGSEVMLGNYDFENNISNTVLYGSGDYDIQWEPSILLDNSNSPNPIFIQPFASQNFSVKVTDNVSGITISDIVNVKVKETPSISMPILMNHPKNTPLDLTQLISNINGGTAPYSVQWSQLVNGEYIKINNPTDIIPATGINKFFATALDSNACTSKPKQLVVYVSPRKDGIDSEIIKSVNGTIVFAAYPIPAVSELNTLIELTESKPAILRIIDTEGSEIISNTIIPGNTENTISISELASGVYFIQIETDDDFAIMKFIKQ